MAGNSKVTLFRDALHRNLLYSSLLTYLLTYLINYLLSPWSRILLEKLIGFQLIVSFVLLLVLSCVVCNCCWLAVCIVVVVLSVSLSSCAYLLYYVCIAVLYFRCRTVG